VTLHTSGRVFGEAQIGTNLAKGQAATLTPALGSKKRLAPVVDPAALDPLLNPVGTAGDAMNEGRSSREGAEAGGPNGFINSWHRRLCGRRRRELLANAGGIGSGFN
jgi:hypothetical protein